MNNTKFVIQIDKIKAYCNSGNAKFSTVEDFIREIPDNFELYQIEGETRIYTKEEFLELKQHIQKLSK